MKYDVLKKRISISILYLRKQRQTGPSRVLRLERFDRAARYPTRFPALYRRYYPRRPALQSRDPNKYTRVSTYRRAYSQAKNDWKGSH